MKRIALGIACLLVASVAQAIQSRSTPHRTRPTETRPTTRASSMGREGAAATKTRDVARPGGDTGSSENGNNTPHPYPLTQSYGDDAGELGRSRRTLGRDFFLGLDINDTSTGRPGHPTVSFYGVGGVLLSSYTFTPTTLVPNVANGVGYADYILAVGCRMSVVRRAAGSRPPAPTTRRSVLRPGRARLTSASADWLRRRCRQVVSISAVRRRPVQ